jgi:hypothetical protein
MWQWVKIPKGIALVAFFLPWLTVSCSNEQIASVSGWNLTTGSLSIINPVTRITETHNGHPSALVFAAFLVVLLGLIFSFCSPKIYPEAPKSALATSVVALGLAWWAVSSINGATIASQASRQQSGVDAATAAMIRVDYDFGFWILVASLVAAAMMSAVIVFDPEGAIANIGGSGSTDPDTAFWDGVAPGDPDGLQEYLIRFPEGRFAGLAKQKLARANVDPSLSGQ